MRQQGELKFDFEKIDRQKLFDYLSYPERCLLLADTNEITQFKDKWKTAEWNVNIITFNYTRIIEGILGGKNKNIHIGTHHKLNIALRGIHHIHGYFDDQMVLGVNDPSQIKNVNFQDHIDVLEAIVKPTCNKANKHTIDDLCSAHVNSANLICIFGSSIGCTDKIWWEQIGERLKKDCSLVIFTRGEEISRRNSHKANRVEREIRDLFLNKTKLSESEKQAVKGRIYVGVNRGMFSDIFCEQNSGGNELTLANVFSN